MGLRRLTAAAALTRPNDGPLMPAPMNAAGARASTLAPRDLGAVLEPGRGVAGHDVHVPQAEGHEVAVVALDGGEHGGARPGRRR